MAPKPRFVVVVAGGQVVVRGDLIFCIAQAYELAERGYATWIKNQPGRASHEAVQSVELRRADGAVVVRDAGPRPEWFHTVDSMVEATNKRKATA